MLSKLGHTIHHHVVMCWTQTSASHCFPQEFTQSCLRHEAKLRPTAHDLLFHRVLFEVHSLKLLAAHCLINNQCEFITSTHRAYHIKITCCVLLCADFKNESNVCYIFMQNCFSLKRSCNSEYILKRFTPPIDIMNDIQ